MPSIQLLAEKDQARLDGKDSTYYMFEAKEFEMFPKVNYVVRTTFCNLGLWNLDATYKNVTQFANAEGYTESDQWGLGQIFIR